MGVRTQDKSQRSKLFRILGDENRLRILEELFTGACNVSELARKLNIEQSLLSHHLSALKKSRLVEFIRRGKEIYYELAVDIRHSASTKTLDLECCSIKLRSETTKPAASNRRKRS